MASDDSSTPTGPKSRQERIRDNQRRSRARKQEYLADLERRLNECYVVCREADLQRTAFTDLQVENTRLRELLNFAGVSPALIESYLQQDAGPSQSEAPSTLRQLRPKILAPDDSTRPSLPSSCTVPGQCSQSSCATTSFSRPGFQTTQAEQSRYGFATSATSATTTMSDLSAFSALPSPDWLFAPEGANAATQSDSASDSDFYCDAFLVPPNGPLLPDDGNTVLCSVAKAMIDQYGLGPQQMHEIKMRLATGFSRSTFAGQGCRVNNQLLFQVLNEISAKRSVAE